MRNSSETPPDKVQEVTQLVDSIPKECGISNREGQLLYYFAKSRRGEGVIVEIGSWKGGSTIWLAKGALTGSGVKVYAIDPHKGTLWHTEEQQSEDTYPIFRQNIKRAGVENVVIPLVMKSEEAIKGWSQPIGLLWIDGSHDYEDVKGDFMLYEPYLEVGGIIAFHDCWHPGPCRLVREKVLKSGRFVKIGHVEKIIFATKVKTSSLGEKQVRFRLRLLLMSYACDLLNFLAKSEYLRPIRDFIFRSGKKILAIGGRW